LIVRESQLSVPGATYSSDSWYIVEDDINIYNTTMHKTTSPTPRSRRWSPRPQRAHLLRPLTNACVNPVANPNRNVQLASDEGHTRVAVKTKELASCPAGSGLSGTCWRYDYAVHNFDFARIVTGAAPNDLPPNLRILSNKGFQSF